MALGRLYKLAHTIAVTAPIDFYELIVPSDAVVILRSVRITQSTEAGDSMSEQIRFQIKRGVGSTSGSGGSALVAGDFEKVQTGDAATGVTGEKDNTTQGTAGGGSLDILLEEADNVHNGWLHAPPPDERFIFSPGEEIYISSPTTPLDSITFSVDVLFEEIGG